MGERKPASHISFVRVHRRGIMIWHVFMVLPLYCSHEQAACMAISASIMTILDAEGKMSPRKHGWSGHIWPKIKKLKDGSDKIESHRDLPNPQLHTEPILAPFRCCKAHGGNTQQTTRWSTLPLALHASNSNCIKCVAGRNRHVCDT